MQVIFWICVALASALTLRYLIMVGVALYIIFWYIRRVGMDEWHAQTKEYGSRFVAKEAILIYTREHGIDTDNI